MMNARAPIGGFFPLALPHGTSPAGGVLQAWTGGRPFTAFVNARSALHALIRQLDPPCVWLPSFICDAVAEGVPRTRQRFYAISETLSADTQALAAATAGDMVLGVNYFGFGPDEAFLRFVATRPDLVFVEDCAQCAMPGPAWGDWRLFSPRKVVGVADGGILLGTRPGATLPQPGTAPDDPAAIWRASLLRYEDPHQEGVTPWHPENQAKEARMRVESAGATRLSLALLGALDPQDMVRRRRENFAALQTAIGAYRLPLRERADSAPFAFPVQLAPQERDTVLRGLHAKGIYAAIHWRDLPVDPRTFKQAHALSHRLISLPCDQRYDATHMDYIATTFRQILR